ncbi:MAG TPA: DNA primase [Planctomycetota bacterium]|nr:DNA primase [Planctomycetota bacterium]
MARIPEEVLRAIEESVDIVDVVSRYVTLKRSGRNFKGLCPFHEEKTPSFTVFPESRRFKCFGCGEGGGVFSFLMKRGNLRFVEVVEELARDANIPLPQEDASPGEVERARLRTDALRALEFAAGFFAAVLARDAGQRARDYLARRSFSAETIAAFRLGYAPDDGEALLGYAGQKGIPVDALAAAGLVRRNDRGHFFDMFRGRVMFPIHDLRGRVIGFGARTLGDDQPKYLNSPDGMLFHKSREMYGLNLAREASRTAGRLLVVEGYTDVMHCHQAGLREVAAGLGTALTRENAQQLRRFGVPVFLVFDGDEAGLKAAERAAETLLAEQVDGAVALLPPGQDPADVVVASGREPIDAAAEHAVDLWSYRMDRAIARHGTGTLDGREKVARDLVGVIGRIGDPVRAELALKLLAERTGVHESTLRSEVKTPRTTPGAEPGRVAVSTAWIDTERHILRAGLEDASLWERVEVLYPAERFRDEGLRFVASAFSDLHRRGESVTREGLLSVLAEKDEAVRALQALEPAADARHHAEAFLARLAREERLREAGTSVEAVVRARKDFPAVTPP